MAACGLDFGTSNTTLGIAGSGHPELVALEGAHTTIPSAVFYRRDGSSSIGRDAIQHYVDGEDGRLMRSLKSVLGSSLIEEMTQVGRQQVRFRDVIADYLKTVKQRAETGCSHELRQVVHGRPVVFVDDNPAADRRAEAMLRQIAQEIGFADISFQYEPIAAALDYERQVATEELALIADIGGGTSDFSIVRLGPQRHKRADRADDILANDGVRIGGTDFDRQLSLRLLMPLLGHGSAMKQAGQDIPNGYFHDLATWSSINRLYKPQVLREIQQIRRDAAEPDLLGRLVKVVEEQRGHTLAMQIEAAKIDLSDRASATVDLAWIEPDLRAGMDRKSLAKHTGTLARRIAERVETCLAQAQLQPDRIDAVFTTGGSTQLAHVRQAITAALPKARVVAGDIFGSVGIGLALEAARRYGV